jgi:peptidoglycan/LPS O-acetylase OafA/YrhL
MRSPVKSPVSEGRLKELDGWRAISVLLVLAHHLGSYQYASFMAPHHRVAEFLSHCGPLGVKVFFVISGFVICRLLLVEESRTGAVSLKGFYIRRMFRILPPYFLGLAAICALLSLQMIVESWRMILVAAVFLYDFRPLAIQSHSWFVGHTWSLAVEEQFYLVFPALWVLTRRTGRKQFFLVVFFLLVAWNLLAAVFDWNRLMSPTIRAGFICIACGVLMAIFERRARTLAMALPGFAVAGIGLVLLWHPTEFFGLKAALYDSIYTPPAIAILLIFSVERKGWLSAFLCWRPVQAVGLTSYGIYLWQQLFTAPAKYYTALGKPIALCLPLLLVVVPFSWFFVEKPAMKLGRSMAAQVKQKFVGEEVLV